MKKNFADHTHPEIVTSIATMQEAMTGVEDSLGVAIRDHNNNTDAHPYLIQLINQLMESGGGGGTFDPTVVETLIKAHNDSSLSHSDIRTSLSQIPFKTEAEKSAFQQMIFDEIVRKVSDEVSKIEIPDFTETITTLIKNHNDDVTSHASLLSLIDDLKDKIDEIDISGGVPPDVISRITTLETGLGSLRTIVQDLVDNPSGGITEADVTQRIATHNADASAHGSMKTEILSVIPTKVAEATADILQSHETDPNAHSSIIVSSAEINTRISNHDTSSSSHSDMRNRLQTVEQTVGTLVSSSGISETRAVELINEHNESSTTHNDIRTSIANTNTSVVNLSGRIGAVEGAVANVPTNAQIDKKISDHNAAVFAHPELRTALVANISAHNVSDESHPDMRVTLDDITSQTSSLTTDVTDLTAKVSLLTSIAEGSGQIDLGTITSTITGSLDQHNKDILSHPTIRASISSTINAVTQLSDTLNLITERIDELPMERAQADMEKIEKEIDSRVSKKIEEHDTSLESHKENILKKLSAFETALETIKNQTDVGFVEVEF